MPLCLHWFSSRYVRLVLFLMELFYWQVFLFGDFFVWPLCSHPCWLKSLLKSTCIRKGTKQAQCSSPVPRFLDNRLFATCSDDTTIALWDLRKLNTKVCTLHGHTSWVKNIEYDTNTRLLVTSGFDGNVIIWDTNRYVPTFVLLRS